MRLSASTRLGVLLNYEIKDATSVGALACLLQSISHAVPRPACEQEHRRHYASASASTAAPCRHSMVNRYQGSTGICALQAAAAGQQSFGVRQYHSSGAACAGGRDDDDDDDASTTALGDEGDEGDDEEDEFMDESEYMEDEERMGVDAEQDEVYADDMDELSSESAGTAEQPGSVTEEESRAVLRYQPFFDGLRLSERHEQQLWMNQQLQLRRQIQADVFGYYMNPHGGRTGRKILKKALVGDYMMDWYIPDMARMDPMMQDADREEREEQLSQLRRRGKGPPKKGQGKRAKQKK